MQTSPVPDFRERITVDPAIVAGKPVVSGTRIPVELILRHLAEDPDLDELFAAFPRLTVDDVRASLDYARAVLDGEVAPPVRDTDVPANSFIP